jgi:undecaprenyl-diphosphatase
MMWEAIVLGILQGLLEWLPVSSQGNLVLVMVVFLGIEESQALSLSVYLHAGTLLSLLVYFRQVILDLLRALPDYRLRGESSREKRLISFLLLATAVTGIIGYPIFELVRATTTLGEIFIALIGAALIFTGLSQKTMGRLGKRTTEDVGLTDALLLGVLQGFSAFPGVSRSGITTSALLFRRFNSESALNISFLMSIPAILVAEIGLSLTAGVASINAVDIFVGCCSSFITGLISIHVLLKIARRIELWAFCVAVGSLALLPLLGFLL